MSFQGQATVVDDTGHSAEMNMKITLRSHEPLDWSTHGVTTANPDNLSGPAALRLANGAEARVLVQNVSFTAGSFAVPLVRNGSTVMTPDSAARVRGDQPSHGDEEMAARVVARMPRGDTVTVRSVKRADCPGIVKVAEDSGEEFTTDDYLIGRPPGGWEILVAVDEADSVVGWLEGTLDADVADHLAHPDHPPPHAYIHAMAVAKVNHRRGIGRQLLAEFVRRARDAGLTWLALTPMDGDGMENRTAFFRATGLRCVDPRDPNQGMVAELAEMFPTSTTAAPRRAVIIDGGSVGHGL